MNLNSWDYYELEKEMANATLGKLLELYKRETQKYSEKCSEYPRYLGKLSEEDIKKLEKECEFLRGTTMKLALRIADGLTKI